MSVNFGIRNDSKQVVVAGDQSTLDQSGRDELTNEPNEQNVASSTGVLVDDIVLEVLRKSQLEAYTDKFVFVFNVRRFDHYSHVRDKDMQDIGMQQPQIRQLREQILKMSREMWNRSDPKQVYVVRTHSTQTQDAVDGTGSHDKIKVYEKFGGFTWAQVRRGSWTRSDGYRIDVAAKILRYNSLNMEDQRTEASQLRKHETSSPIQLYGMTPHPTLNLYDLCDGDTLLNRLRNDKKPIPLVSKLHNYCIQLAEAMQFLEIKNLSYNSLTARNVLLSHDENTIRISDFGLVRALMYDEPLHLNGPPDFAGRSPERLRHRKTSIEADIWSYGVVMWELFTFGKEPWVGCRAIDVLKNIDAGKRLEKPKYCSERIYQIMSNCWKSNPAERCKFETIREDLNSAFLLDAVARERYNSIRPGALHLAKGEEMVVIEKTGQTWFGQNKANREFGSVPKTVFLTPEEKEEEYWRVFIDHGNQMPEETQPLIQKPIQQQPVQPILKPTQQQQVELPIPSTTVAPVTTTTTSQVTRPLAPPAVENRDVSAPAPIAPTTTTATTSASSMVTRRSTQTITMSEEERRSRIIQNVASALPAPSALLLGSNSTSALLSTTTQTAVKDRPAAAQVKPSHPQPTMPPKKTSEPILSTEVLHPTRVPSAVSAPKPVSQPVPTQQPVPNPSPPVVQTCLADKKPANPLAQSTNVPLFNITNSSMYPQLNSYLNYGNGYQPYGYGMNYNTGYPGTQGYNPSTRGMKQLPLANQAVNSLPPLIPPENLFSGSAQPLDESAITTLLGAHHRSEKCLLSRAPAAPVATQSVPASFDHNNWNTADKKKMLNNKVSFTESGNIDNLLTQCKNDKKLAAKVIDLVKSYFLAMHVTSNAKQEIQERQKALEDVVKYFEE